MTMTDTLIRTAVDRAKPLLDRFGILAAPVRGLLDTRRTLTIERPPSEVRTFLTNPAHVSALFGAEGTVEAAGPVVSWRLDDRGCAEATIAAGPDDWAEVRLEVHLERPSSGGRPRYADNAGVIAARALHRAKSLMETGEMATLAKNPAGRPEPDPYGD